MVWLLPKGKKKLVCQSELLQLSMPFLWLRNLNLSCGNILLTLGSQTTWEKQKGHLNWNSDFLLPLFWPLGVLCPSDNRSNNQKTVWHSTLPSCAVIGWNICRRTTFCHVATVVGWCAVTPKKKPNGLNTQLQLNNFSREPIFFVKNFYKKTFKELH